MPAVHLLKIVSPVKPSAAEHKVWVEQQHLRQFLEHERSSASVTLYGTAYDHGGSVFVHSLLVPARDINFKKAVRWPSWEGNPFDSPSCGLVYYGGYGARVEYNESWSHNRQPLFRHARRLIFGRSFEGSHDGRHYYELAQELAHAHGLHWVEERDAWCRLDDAGDVAEFARIEHVGTGGRGSATIVSLNRDLLNLHMAATQTCLVQMFDSTTLPSEFHGFDGGEEKVFTNLSNGLVMKYRLDDHGASYFRGVCYV